VGFALSMKGFPYQCRAPDIVTDSPNCTDNARRARVRDLNYVPSFLVCQADCDPVTVSYFKLSQKSDRRIKVKSPEPVKASAKVIKLICSRNTHQQSYNEIPLLSYQPLLTTKMLQFSEETKVSGR
jgi:hypothetical protein